MPKNIPRNTLLCTVGTSLFYPNLSKLSDTDPAPPLAALAQAYARKDWQKVAELLHELKPTERRCGAEINSVADLLTHEYVNKDSLHLLFSDTEDGENIAVVLKDYFILDDWKEVEAHRVDDLKDGDPRAFRTQGLRNLAKLLGERVREAGADFCAINATGGYKAQISIAVLMGQALEIPVYYKHERFNAIIPFPPMPVALDFELWERASGMFRVLSQPNACEPWEHFCEDWDERFESLVNRVTIDGTDCLELSATGQIFHETFRSRFQRHKTARFPRDAHEKRPPNLKDHDYKQARDNIERFLQKVTDARPYICSCHTTYWNPDLPEKDQFRMRDGKAQGIYSNGTWCVKFTVLTTAGDDEDQLRAVVADLNEWLEEV